jgi:homogentisate phytyltransferase/homogentisate geranylgeranyltransferase
MNRRSFVTPDSSSVTADAPPATLRAWWEFTRPHTIIGTSLAVCVLYLLAAHSAGRQSWPVLATALFASLAVNLYIVGLNQLTDIEIDQINKPYLPLAAGSMRYRTAVLIVTVSGTLALVASALQGPYLFATIATIFVIGTCYSLPPVRLKRFPSYAASSIIIARAIVGNIGIQLTFSAVLTGHPRLPGSLVLFVLFMIGFVVVIALMKDIPDVAGDRTNDISTIAIRLGPARTLTLCRIILTLCDLGAPAAVWLGVGGVNPAVFTACHAAALLALWIVGVRVDGTDQRAVKRYYMLIWKLFYLEFAAFLAACLVS